MTAPARISQADVKRQARGLMAAAREAGWAPGSYGVEVVDGAVKLLPIAANGPSDAAADMERRIREAFGR